MLTTLRSAVLAGAFAAASARAQAPVDSSRASPAAAQLAWTAALDGDVGWLQTTSGGIVVAATEAGLLGLDGATGSILWRKDDLRDPGAIALDVLPGTGLGLLRLSRKARGGVVRIGLEVATGNEIWNSAQIGLEDVEQQIYVPGADLLVLAAKRAEGDGDRIVRAVAVATGATAWTLDLSGKESASLLGQGPALFDTDSTLVVPGPPHSKLDLRAGRRIWQSAPPGPALVKGCDFLASIPTTTPDAKAPERDDPRPLPLPAPLLASADAQRIFAAQGTTVLAFDAASGQPAWATPPGLCGRCVSMQETPHGLLVRTMPEIQGNDELVLLDRGSGFVRWQYPTPPKKFTSFMKNLVSGTVHVSEPLVRGDAIFAVANQDLVRLDPASGNASKVGKVGFASDEDPVVLLDLGDGFVVAGAQNFEWFDNQGRSLRRQHYQAPGDTGGGLAMLLGAAALNAFGTRDVGKVRIHLGASYAPGLERLLLHEFHATSVFDDLVFVLAQDPESMEPELVEMDLRSGEVRGRFPTSSSARYTLDGAHARLYTFDERSIHCFAH